MAMVRCFSLLPVKKEKNKGSEKSSREDFNTLLAKLHSSRISSTASNLESATSDVAVSNDMEKNLNFDSRVMSLQSPVKADVEEAHEREDESEDLTLIKRELCDFDHQGQEDFAGKEYDATKSDPDQANNEMEDKSDGYSQRSVDTTQSGHVSDPGIGKADLWTSLKLKRNCSNLENMVSLKQITHHLPPSKLSFEELSAMANLQSPRSVMSSYSADRIMLKRLSSSQVLPSGSKKLWWKMILWSHRNIHRKHSSNSTLVPSDGAALKSQCGYSSDTLEPTLDKALRHVKSSESITGKSFNKDNIFQNVENQTENQFHNENSGFSPQNQWITFSANSSTFARVDTWVKNLEIQQPLLEDDFDDDGAKSIVFPPSPDAGKSMMRTTSQLTFPDSNLSKDILNANSAVQSLNPASTFAHVSGIGIKAIPAISHFSSLRSVNLSNNFIAHISPGFLPKGIQTLNLSRNKISTIDGLREMTRLRVLDLSYNRISRIGQGLSSCTLIKELYLVGNKISDVEGLHRLLKLAVLDLSFNKITTTKALGQLVANYNSLQALNLLGNPIQSNISDDQLSKAVCGLLPHLVYLNKQPLKAQRAREIISDSVARAALGNGKRSSDRRSLRRVGHGGSSSSRGYRRSDSQKSMNRARR